MKQLITLIILIALIVLLSGCIASDRLPPLYVEGLDVDGDAIISGDLDVGGTITASGSGSLLVSVWHDSMIEFPFNTYVYVPFNQEYYDTSSMHDNATNNTSLTCTEDGTYLIGIYLDFGASNPSGIFQIILRFSRSYNIATSIITQPSIAYNASLSLQVIYPLLSGDYIEIIVRNLQPALTEYIDPSFCSYPNFYMVKVD